MQKSQAENLTADEKTTIRTLSKNYDAGKIAKLLNKSVNQIVNVLGGTEKKLKHTDRKYMLPKLFREKNF